MTIVEETLRTQRDAWQEITERVLALTSRELPPEAAKRILLFGVGSSYFAAKLTACSLIRHWGRARIPIIACSSLEVGASIFPVRGDWCFAFSHRGKTPATLQALEQCVQAGAFPVLVAGQGAAEPESARLVLTTSAPERVEPHTVSVTGAICAVTTFLMGARATEEWDALRGRGDPNLEQARERAGKGPKLLLGEWEGEWIAREGALKLMEMARLPVRAFGTEEFFHGPRFSAAAKDPIWHVALHRDARSAELEPAVRVHVSGGSALAWVPALVELQWLAFAVALNLDVDPDSAGK